MRLTIITPDNKFLNFTVSSTESIMSFKTKISEKAKIPPQFIQLQYQGKTIPNESTISSSKITPDAVLRVTRLTSADPTFKAPVPQKTNIHSAASLNAAALFIKETKSNPQKIDQLLRMSPAFAQAIMNENVAQVAEFMKKIGGIHKPPSDPMNPAYQKQLEEQIKQKRIQENFEKAITYYPETMASVNMLYIPAKLNKIAIKCFVDSGAQTTIISYDCAKECNLHNMIDRRFASMARGIGTSKIIGVIHLVDIEIAGKFYPIKLSVMPGLGESILIGLDMLKRHQVCLNLKTTTFDIGTDKVPFLPENQLPLHRIGRPPVPNSSTSSKNTLGVSTDNKLRSLSQPPLSRNGPSTVKPLSSGSVSSQTSESSDTSTHPTPASPSPSISVAPTSKSSFPTISFENVKDIQNSSGKPMEGIRDSPQPISKYSEPDIKNLQDLGNFNRDTVIQALNSANGDVETAAGILLSLLE